MVSIIAAKHFILKMNIYNGKTPDDLTRTGYTEDLNIVFYDLSPTDTGF